MKLNWTVPVIMIWINQPRMMRGILGHLTGPIYLRGHGKPAIKIVKPQLFIDSGNLVHLRETPKYQEEHGHGKELYPVTATTIAQTDKNNRILWLRPQHTVMKFGLVTDTGHLPYICRDAMMIMDLTEPEQGFQVLCKVSTYGYETKVVGCSDMPPVLNFWRDWNQTSYVLTTLSGSLQFAIDKVCLLFKPR